MRAVVHPGRRHRREPLRRRNFNLGTDLHGAASTVLHRTH